MSITAGLISGFDEARRSYRDAELKKAAATQDKEFSILQALATHVDPELAAVGAAGLLQLAGGGGPKARKGLGGFLGEVESSTYLPELQKLFGAGTSPMNAPAAPGSAAQPDSAVIEPARQARGPGVGSVGVGSVPPPSFDGATPGGPGSARVHAPTPGADIAGGPLGGPPGIDLGAGSVPDLAEGMAGMAGAPPGPPPPETSQQKMRRLYPSASDIAADTTFRNLQARLAAVLQGVRAARSPEEVDLVRGLAGAPRRNSPSRVIDADYRTADGQTLQGSVIFDPDTNQATVDGLPVTILKQHPKTPPRPIGLNVAGPGGTVNRQFLDPSNPGGAPLAEVATGIQAPTGPAPFSGTVTTDEGVFRLPRGGGEGVKIGDAPPRAGELDQTQQEATAWLTDVNAQVKAALSGFNQTRPPGLKATALPVAQQDQIVQTVTKGRYKTLGALTAATKRTAGGGGTPDPAASARERANRVRQRLESQSGSVVHGSGVPKLE